MHPRGVSVPQDYFFRAYITLCWRTLLGTSFSQVVPLSDIPSHKYRTLRTTLNFDGSSMICPSHCYITGWYISLNRVRRSPVDLGRIGGKNTVSTVFACSTILIWCLRVILMLSRSLGTIRMLKTRRFCLNPKSSSAISIVVTA